MSGFIHVETITTAMRPCSLSHPSSHTPLNLPIWGGFRATESVGESCVNYCWLTVAALWAYIMSKSLQTSVSQRRLIRAWCQCGIMSNVMRGTESGPRSRSPNSCNKSLLLSKNDQRNELKITKHARKQFYEKTKLKRLTLDWLFSEKLTKSARSTRLNKFGK